MGREIFLVLLLVCSSSRAAFEQSPHGARAVGLGGSTVSVQGDLWSAFLNPSCLPTATATSIGVEYLPAVYGLWEIRRGAVTVSAEEMLRVFNCGIGMVLLVPAAKGLEVKSLARMSEVIADETHGRVPVVVLSGPTFASEVARGLPAAARGM